MTSATVDNNKRIAKNTLIMYFRMFVVVGVSLYTSRAVLGALGVEDFGTYGLVGGIATAMSFLNASMAGATSRFITYALGEGNFERLKQTFQTAFFTHLLIAGVIFIIGEIIGVWFLNTLLNIPDGRMQAANWIYQFALVSTVLGVAQVPFSATIIAHEHMSTYAWAEITQVFLKLGAVFALSINWGQDRLIWYGGLMMVVSISISLLYVIYSTHSFKEVSFIPKREKTIFKKLLNYSGWDLYQTVCLLLAQQGVNFVINIFYGVVVNAAMSISGQVINNISAFAANISISARPQIVKYYAEGNLSDMTRLIYNTSRAALLALAFVIIPITVELPFILKVWLKEPPVYATIFTFIGLLCYLPIGAFQSINASVTATGKNVRLSFGNGTLFLTNFLWASLIGYLGCEPWVYCIGSGVVTLIVVVHTSFLCQKYIQTFRMSYLWWNIFLPFYLIVAFVFITCYYVIHLQPESWLRLIGTGCLSTFLLGIASYSFFLTKSQRAFVRTKLLESVGFSR